MTFAKVKAPRYETDEIVLGVVFTLAFHFLFIAPFVFRAIHPAPPQAEEKPLVERPVVEADAFVGIDPHDDLGEVGAGAKCEGGFDDLLGEGEALRGIDRRLQEITGPHAQVRAGHEELGVRHPRA